MEFTPSSDAGVGIAKARELTRQQLLDQAQATHRLALVVARPPSDELLSELMLELSAALQAAAAFVSTFSDDSRHRLRTQAMCLDGALLPNFEYDVAGSPCEAVIGHKFRFVPCGVLAQIDPRSDFAAAGLDAYAAFPINDSHGAPLGVVAVMHRRPVADGDTAHTEALLNIVAARLASELERRDTLVVMQRAALAVSSARGATVFDELTRMLATLLGLEYAHIARVDPADPEHLHVLALHADGRITQDLRYPLDSSPCRHVLGQQFRAFPSGVALQFPDDGDVLRLGVEAYAGHPLTGAAGQPLGVIAVRSSRPLVDIGRIEAMLKIFAVRAAAEVERLSNDEALRRSVASYHAIFDNAADSILVLDWETLALHDANRTACEAYGYSREELLSVDPAQLTPGIPPYDHAHVIEHLRQARQGRRQPFEWLARLRDGRLLWQEVRLRPLQIDGRLRILAFARDISERKAAEEQLLLSEAQYRAIFNASVDAMTLWDSRMRRVDVNDAYLRMYGWQRQDVIGLGHEHLPFNVDYYEPRRDLVRRALAGENCRAELESIRKDGQRIMTEIQAIPFTHRGEPHVLTIGRDLTERKQAEAQLREREELHRAIFDGSVDAMVLYDSALRMVDVNTALATIRGYPRHELVGQPWAHLLDAEYAAPLLPLIEQALAGREVTTVRSAAQSGGSQIDMELRFLPVRVGGKAYALGIARNVTERLEHERELQRGAARLSATVNAAFDCVIGMDGEGRIVEFNAAAERVFGHRREQVLGQELAALILPERHRAAHRRGLRHFRPGSTGTMLGRLVETTAQTADGREIPVEMAISEARVPEGSIFVGHLRDISARRAAEAERTQLEAQLRQAQKMEAIGQLTGGIAHDFNNILTSVLGYVVLAQERAEALGDERIVRQLGQARLATVRARDLVTQMLAFGRRQAGKRLPMRPSSLLHESAALLRATLPSSVLLDIDASCAAAGLIIGDAGQLGQVLLNLGINARDAVNGSGQLHLSARDAYGGWHCQACGLPAEHDRWVELAVKDNGCGIARDILTRMFDPFFTTKPAGSGSGMGLAMVHGIVHDHGGHIVVDTELGQGTTFRILLPRCEPTEIAADMAEAASSASGAAPRPSVLEGRLLVVEDDVQVGTYLREQLESWGLEVVLFHDPREALEWLRDGANGLQALLTDLTMPHLSGITLAGEAGRLRPGLPVLLVSADLATIDTATLAAAGIAATLAKPIEPPLLRRAIRQVLRAGSDANDQAAA